MTASLRDRIATGLEDARARSLSLTDVDDGDLVAQHSPLMSPLVWDLAHIGNYEELWLLRATTGVDATRPEIDDLYDAFRHPRKDRPSLPILGPAEARAYVSTIRGRVLDSLENARLDGSAPLLDGGFVYGMVLQHEQMHDETMLATHQLRTGPPILAEAPPLPAGRRIARREVVVPAGPFTMGTSTDPWSYDNERGAHTVDLPAFRIDVLPVSNAAHIAFVEDGGYDDPRLWTGDGWAWRTEAGLTAPQFWRREGGGWVVRRFGRDEPLAMDEPVQHVCWYEADAHARWAGRRLPTEAEWEKAARWDPVAGHSRRWPWGDDEPTAAHANLALVGGRAGRPAPLGAYPAGASAYGVEQLVGDVWEWTSSAFTAYPGFRAFPYREYSEVFFGRTGRRGYNVLRGGSWATHPSAARATFRNWDHPIRRQIFTGFRLARDV